MSQALHAILDLGSNSARVVVFGVDPEGSLEVVADEHAPLRLIRELDDDGRLRSGAIDRSIRLLRDFRAVALGAGAERVPAFATAALREAANSGELIERARAEAGVDVRILDAGVEARAAFLGAILSLPVLHGLILDIGGGSLQLSHFRDRRLRRSWSFPLGALRVSDAFLRSDPPTAAQMHELRAHLRRSLALAGVPRLREDEVLVGTGGTIRNLAKADARSREYPILRLHGYELTARRLGDLTALLAARKRRARANLAGMNADRADSIVGGSLAAEGALEQCGAHRILVAGLGLREGLLLELLGLTAPAPDRVRRMSVAALCRRFAVCGEERTQRRLRLVRSLRRALEPSRDPRVEEMLEHAAAALDIGRAVDYYRRHQHAASILRGAGLLGFGHREIAMTAAIVELSDRSGWNPKRYRPLLRKQDQPVLDRAGILLALADQIEHRLAPGATPEVRCRATVGAALLETPALSDWDVPWCRSRFQHAFGKELRVRSGERRPRPAPSTKNAERRPG